MTLKEMIPEAIDAGEIIDFSKDDSVIVLQESLTRHKEDTTKLLEKNIYFPAFVSLMTAIEIYFKIHLTIFCFLHTKNLSSTKRKQFEIFTGDTKLLNSFQYSVKSRYSHNLMAMFKDLSILIEESPEELKNLQSSVAQLARGDWVNKRYDAKSIANDTTKIKAANESFELFVKWMKEKGLEVLDKVGNQQ